VNVHRTHLQPYTHFRVLDDLSGQSVQPFITFKLGRQCCDRELTRGFTLPEVSGSVLVPEGGNGRAFKVCQHTHWACMRGGIDAVVSCTL